MEVNTNEMSDEFRRCIYEHACVPSAIICQAVCQVNNNSVTPGDSISNLVFSWGEKGPYQLAVNVGPGYCPLTVSTVRETPSGANVEFCNVQ